jgi:repressor LexA
MLTKKQQELLIFIHQRLGEGGVSPSFDEMKDALRLKSKSGIHRLITGLEERGFIRRLPHRARALEVLRLPDGAAADDGAATTRPADVGADAPDAGDAFPSRLVDGGFDRGLPARMTAANSQSDGTVQLPLLGRIAAGTPIEALRDPSTFADVPASLLGGGEHYALEVAGDSMLEAGIFDGDTAVIRRTDSAENGTIVVALVDESEVTLKRLRRRGDKVALEPANAAYETRIFGPDRVRVQGRLVALLRRYA